ncbi:hypothetical protein CPB84DRAFT_1690770, partial [Gymnopilus junonius]
VVNFLDDYARTKQQPISITFDQITSFIAYASCLKDSILLVQPSTYTIAHLLILSPAIELFLSEACGIPFNCITGFGQHLQMSLGNTQFQFSSLDHDFETAYCKFEHVKGIGEPFSMFF